MSTTGESSLAEALTSGVVWARGSDIGGAYGTRRIRPKVDQVAAIDINQLRDMVELLVYHTHEYTDSATTVVNNGC